MYPPRLPLPFGLKIPMAMFEKGQAAGTRDWGEGQVFCQVLGHSSKKHSGKGVRVGS